METKKKVTMQDVAKKAGVSDQTVSRVLNNSCNVSPSTKEKIEQAIADLKYVPNLLAQELAKKERKVLGIISTAVLSQASVDVAASVRRYAMHSGYSVDFSLLDNHNYDGIQEVLLEMRSRLITKVIINVPVDSADAIKLTADNTDITILFVDVDPYCPVLNVTFNPSDGTLFSASHLRQLGH